MKEKNKQNLEAQIRECNEMCQACMEDFQREGMTFSAGLCRYCQNGSKLHRLLTQTSEAEAKWDKLDWNSCKYERLYTG